MKSLCFLGVVLTAVAWLPTSVAFQAIQPSESNQFSQRSACHATLSPRDDSQKQRYPLSSEDMNREIAQEVTRRNYIWFFPPALTAVAFTLFDETSRVFHRLLDYASGHNWVPADGGRYIADVTKTALTGPVTFSVSILFSSLVGLTVSTLNARQTSLQKLFVNLHQEGQELKNLLEECPAEIRDQGLDLLTLFMHRLDQTIRTPDQESTATALRLNQELHDLTQLVHQRGKEINNDMILAEIYASLGRIKNVRIELWAAYSNNFSVAHYTNMIVLASALLFIFLLQTDSGAMLFLLDFQLSICWALLIGAYSLLAAVIIDLRGIPPQLTTRLDQKAFVDWYVVRKPTPNMKMTTYRKSQSK